MSACTGSRVVMHRNSLGLLILALYKLFVCLFVYFLAFFLAYFLPYTFFYIYSFPCYLFPDLSSFQKDLFHFQAGDCRKWLNLASVFLCFCCIWFNFSVLSQEIGWEERLWNDLFCVGWDINLNSINHYAMWLGLHWCHCVTEIYHQVCFEHKYLITAS